ncbi:21.9 kDa heat shock protein [Durio zibethinus]|uniref:21.9 kDa heat shock protein n=1 Tax=Durio zibethinus TaxID=66656 RepID=A0A6P6BC57_DURZI|nr:21.9 kDa heat shock protein [Durio zibethinus]
MESEAARRRISTISGHFSPNDDIFSATHLLPMNCSGSLNSVIRRCDNRMYFARQGSAYQACFMRQVSKDERTAPHCAACPKSSCTPIESSNDSEAPLFSRRTMVEPNLSNLAAIQPLGLDWGLSLPDPPKFARPNKSTSEEMPLQSKKKTCSRSNGIEWLPRMDIAESGPNYVMVVEIPGVSISDIRVEVDDRNLTVTGQRTSQCLKLAAGCSNDSISSYHKREISQGPYQVVWPLPTNANRDSISAEFVDGFLRVVIPKL